MAKGEVGLSSDAKSGIYSVLDFQIVRSHCFIKHLASGTLLTATESQERSMRMEPEATGGREGLIPPSSPTLEAPHPFQMPPEKSLTLKTTPPQPGKIANDYFLVKIGGIKNYLPQAFLQVPLNHS